MTNRELGSDHYDVTYQSGGYNQVYFLDAGDVPIYSELWATVVEHTKGFSEVVDLGCGPGHFPQMLRQKGVEIPYTGYDFSAVALKQARDKNLENCNFNQANLYEIGKIESDNFVCLEVLEHIERDLELLEATVPTGANIIFSVPNYNSRGHVRTFATEEEVIDRYSGLLTLSHIDTILFGSHKIYIFSGVRK